MKESRSCNCALEETKSLGLFYMSSEEVLGRCSPSCTGIWGWWALHLNESRISIIPFKCLAFCDKIILLLKISVYQVCIWTCCFLFPISILPISSGLKWFFKIEWKMDTLAKKKPKPQTHQYWCQTDKGKKLFRALNLKVPRAGDHAKCHSKKNPNQL